ncbi:hypothetical protein BBK82_40520 [Lentzea guizhouensis]|uniref:DUF4062 domain-containing protein n=1 Tax=Lentzea guizhouensis TaxID=1586287 RepID=A0A1B2HUA7_9PSEU|nr:DUF4062 domain-containing protein [Lentzea guizhouensis]ANZ41320.1 hypothetical protein BBK82_40520 [Lentzea guizhouensis]
MAAPRQYPGVMVSSTFADLVEHRVALMKALHGQQLHAVAMEDDSARLVDVLQSSLEKVRDSSAYVVVISRRYGSIPAGHDLSLTHLEFREAVRLGRPILVFVMGPRHALTEADVELDAEKRKKLEAFREEAKLAGGAIHRVYKEFNDLAEFSLAATQSVAELRRMLDGPGQPRPSSEPGIPVPPALYAQPRYLGSHAFVGREAQLTTLSDWAGPSDPHTVLLFEAIGGTGKSILTWEWVTRHASGVRGDRAGTFWYSFYEAGAVMADFCRRALAYMTGRPLADFEAKKQLELTELLVQQLVAQPWLLVLDGLERVLVAYHRLDAAHVHDENAGASGDNPCTSIRPDDDDLLRALVTAAPSKILITSRLIPNVFLNRAGQLIPGVWHERLPGLRPSDAEALLRSCGVFGDSAAMRNYLQLHCDCHPLVIGIIGGLVNDHLPARGDFDQWSTDPRGGGGLVLGGLDLVQKRNHILRAAHAALRDASRQLLSTLALLSESVDYETLSALGAGLDEDLTTTVTDLERRGLLQYDKQTRDYDLHPVVRAVAASGVAMAEKQVLGQRVVDHFSSRRAGRHAEVTCLADLRDDLTVVRTLLQMGKTHMAYAALAGDLLRTMSNGLEARPEVLATIKPFFPEGWSGPAAGLMDHQRVYLAVAAGTALHYLGESEEALPVMESVVQWELQRGDGEAVAHHLANLAVSLERLNKFALYRRAAWLCLDLAEVLDVPYVRYTANSIAFSWLVDAGEVLEAEEMWARLTRSASHALLRGELLEYAKLLVWKGTAAGHDIAMAEAKAQQDGNRLLLRKARRIRGIWCAQRGEWAQAAQEFGEAVSMARVVGLADSLSETWFALARFHLGELPLPVDQAAELASARRPAHLPLARLWLAIGDLPRATEHALTAHRYAWADGEPHVRRFELRQAEELLTEIGAPVPVLPPYDPAEHPKEPWEEQVEGLIAKLRAAKS